LLPAAAHLLTDGPCRGNYGTNILLGEQGHRQDVVWKLGE
jgi:hypothetical protein